MQSEWNIVGPRAFLFPGYPMAVIVSLSQAVRGELDSGPVPNLLRFFTTSQPKGLARILLNQW
jgi:hypothetical protein